MGASCNKCLKQQDRKQNKNKNPNLKMTQSPSKMPETNIHQKDAMENFRLTDIVKRDVDFRSKAEKSTGSSIQVAPKNFILKMNLFLIWKIARK